VGRRLADRYELGAAIGAGATATVHVGRLHGSGGFTKTVAIKRLHEHLAKDAELRAILLDEARIVSRISHPNVVAVLDVTEDAGEVFLVLEHARGATLAELVERGPVPPAIAVAIMRDALAGLHAAHHARDSKGALLELVHRDVSPRNVIVTTDGIAKVLDFGIARARARLRTTRDGHVRGSLPYMAPEQLRDEPLSARTDVYSAAVVLWEALTGERLFSGDSEGAVVRQILDHGVAPPSARLATLPKALDAVMLRALASDPKERPPSALELAVALETSVAPASASEVARWLEEQCGRERFAEDPWVAAPATAPESAAPNGDRRPRAARLPALVAAFVIVLAAVSGVAAILRRTPASAPPVVRAAEPAAFASTTRAELPPTTTTSAPALPSSSPSSSAALPSRAPATSAPVVTRPAASPVAPPPATSASVVARAPCPPYFVDDAGVRRFNRECLE